MVNNNNIRSSIGRFRFCAASCYLLSSFSTTTITTTTTAAAFFSTTTTITTRGGVSSSPLLANHHPLSKQPQKNHVLVRNNNKNNMSSSSLEDVASNLEHVRLNMKELEIKYNRKENSVRLVAVSKTKPVELVMKAYNEGQRRFGENYAQELMTKCKEMPKDVEWHFIGPLQSNKAAPLVKTVGLSQLKCIETVCTMKLANKLDRAVQTLWDNDDNDNVQLGIYLQINTSGESTKSGLSTMEETCDLAQHIINDCPHLQIQGLMTIGAPNDTTCFDTLVQYRTHLATTVLNVDPQSLELSMGMSGDYDQAIAKGATSIRVGSTIFGNRDYSNLTK